MGSRIGERCSNNLVQCIARSTENSLSKAPLSVAGGCCGAPLLQKAAAASATVILSHADTTAQHLLGCRYEESFYFLSLNKCAAGF